MAVQMRKELEASGGGKSLVIFVKYLKGWYGQKLDLRINVAEFSLIIQTNVIVALVSSFSNLGICVVRIHPT